MILPFMLVVVAGVSMWLWDPDVGRLYRAVLGWFEEEPRVVKPDDLSPLWTFTPWDELSDEEKDDSI